MILKRDLSGEKFSRWTVLKKVGPYLHNGRRKDWLYECKCDCGNVKNVKANALIKGISKSCGCFAADVNSEKHLHSLIGKEFGDWLIIARGKNRNTPKDQSKTYWSCKCKHCNYVKDIYAGNLTSGKSKGCICQRVEKAEQNTISFWNGLYKSYKDGAKRRNRIFDLSLEEFKSLMIKDCHYCGCKPSPRKVNKRLHCCLSINGIDRVDSDKGYTIDNVVTCCYTCNTMKLNFSIDFFFSHIKRILIHSMHIYEKDLDSIKKMIGES